MSECWGWDLWVLIEQGGGGTHREYWWEGRKGWMVGVKDILLYLSNYSGYDGRLSGMVSQRRQERLENTSLDTNECNKFNRHHI